MSRFTACMAIIALLAGSQIGPSAAFSPLPSIGSTRKYRTAPPLGQRFPRDSFLRKSKKDPDNEEERGKEGDEEPVYESVIRVDDGGSDLTDRFKYKVNALMGVFDPQTGADDENQSGNILSAMLKFPVRYSFNVVGRTNGEEKLKDDYIAEVKSIVGSLSGDEDRMQCRITPRGKNFTRVTLQVTVESVAIINSIYDALEKNEKTVMRY